MYKVDSFLIKVLRPYNEESAIFQQMVLEQTDMHRQNK